jgi:hypothetical protein
LRLVALLALRLLLSQIAVEHPCGQGTEGGVELGREGFVGQRTLDLTSWRFPRVNEEFRGGCSSADYVIQFE